MIMDLSSLKKPKRRNRKRVGRGEASGQGKTAGKGHKGQKARSGGSVGPGFEGGQMPLQRRLPKKGFSNAPFKVEFNVVHIKDLAAFTADEVVTPEALREKRIVKRPGPVKLLSDGDVAAAYSVKVDRVSAAARSKIEAAGGAVEELL
jgi:large subunit ribosomal protein L15